MKFIIRRYFSGFCEDEIEANDGFDAILIARNLPIKTDEILMSLEEWEEADDAEPINDY